METPPPPEPKKRRASRGRRSSILFKADGASPTVVNAPINESIQGNTAVEKIAQIKARIQFLQEYKRKLEDELLDWEAIQTKFYEKANSDEVPDFHHIKESKLERELDDCGRSPCYILTHCFNQFQKTWGDHTSQKKHQNATMRRQLGKKLAENKTREANITRMRNIYKEASLDDVNKKIDLWIKVIDFNNKGLQEVTHFMSNMQRLNINDK